MANMRVYASKTPIATIMCSSQDKSREMNAEYSKRIMCHVRVFVRY